MSTYRVECGGDGASSEIVSRWSEVVQTAAGMLFDHPTNDELIDVNNMLANGLDGGDGWDGKRVHLQFEDGWLTVEAT